MKINRAIPPTNRKNAPTGVDGFDGITARGLPRGRTTLPVFGSLSDARTVLEAPGVGSA